MSRLPIFYDDRSFQEQTERMFREMEEKMGFHHPPYDPTTNLAFPNFMSGGTRWPPSFDDNAFFQLRPSGPPAHQEMLPNMRLGSSQSEVLDDATTRALFFDADPQTGEGRGRMFRMSFDARQYDPAEVAVRCEDNNLVVEAKHVEQDSSGLTVNREFQRRIELPRDVDPAKLTSTLSKDGILTVEAPVPPRYHAVVGPTPDRVLLGASSTQARVSPVPLRIEPGPATTGHSRSPLLDATGRLSPFTGNGGVRKSPVPFTSLAPATAFAPVTSPLAQGLTVDVPVFTTDPVTGRRRLELALELGRPYTADDVIVQVDGRRLTIEAKHEAKDEQGRVTTSSTQKKFDVDEQLDEATVQAVMRDDRRMIITGFIKQ